MNLYHRNIVIRIGTCTEDALPFTGWAASIEYQGHATHLSGTFTKETVEIEQRAFQSVLEAFPDKELVQFDQKKAANKSQARTLIELARAAALTEYAKTTFTK